MKIFCGAPSYQDVIATLDTSADDKDVAVGSVEVCADVVLQVERNSVRASDPLNHTVWRVVPFESGRFQMAFSSQLWLSPIVWNQDEVIDRFASLSRSFESAISGSGRSEITESFSVGISQDTVVDRKDISNENENDMDEFLEHSFALHSTAASTSFDTTFNAPTGSSADNHATDRAKILEQRHDAPVGIEAPQLHKLSELPTVDDVVRIGPQTITADLILGVIRLLPEKEVTVRRSGHPIKLIEALLGDDSDAGFRISFWLPVSQDGLGVRQLPGEPKGDNILRDTLQHLKTGDLVLLRNIVISQFRGKVHGQSLARRGSRGWCTSIQLLWRNGVADTRLRSRNHRPLFDSCCFDTGVGELAHLPPTISQRMVAVAMWIKHFIAPNDSFYSTEDKPSCEPRTLKRKRMFVHNDHHGLPPDDTPL